jgi:cell division protein FtsQ
MRRDVDLAQSLGVSGSRRHAVRRPDPEALASMWRGVLLGFSQALLVCVLLAGTYEALPWLQVTFDKPVERVLIKGEFQALDQKAIESAVALYEGDTVLGVDLVGMVSRLEQHPWIAHAHARRVWPDAVEITLIEQKPIAYWGSKAMVNAKGRVFEHLGLMQGKALPRLWSEAGSPAEAMSYYQIFDRQLEPLGLKLASISQNVQGDWRLTLDNGLLVILDRSDPVANVRSFATLHIQLLIGSERKAEVVDMRYRHGAAIRWQVLSPDAAPGLPVRPDAHPKSGDKTASDNRDVTSLVEA